MVRGQNILKVDIVQIRKSENVIGHSAHITDTAIVNLSSLRRDLKSRQSQSNSDTSALTQYVWQCEMLIEICEKLENSNDICLNTVFWYVQSSNAEVFNMCDMPAQTIYKIIAPDLEYWYMECRPKTFAGVQKRPANSDDHSIQPFQPYYHSAQGCAINDLPCSQWKSCSLPGDEDGFHNVDDIDDTDETVLMYNELRSSIRLNNMATKRPYPTPNGSSPEMMPEDFDEMPTLMFNEF